MQRLDGAGAAAVNNPWAPRRSAHLRRLTRRRARLPRPEDRWLPASLQFRNFTGAVPAAHASGGLYTASRSVGCGLGTPSQDTCTLHSAEGRGQGAVSGRRMGTHARRAQPHPLTTGRCPRTRLCCRRAWCPGARPPAAVCGAAVHAARIRLRFRRQKAGRRRRAPPVPPAPPAPPGAAAPVAPLLRASPPLEPAVVPGCARRLLGRAGRAGRVRPHAQASRQCPLHPGGGYAITGTPGHCRSAPSCKRGAGPVTQQGAGPRMNAMQVRVARTP